MYSLGPTEEESRILKGMGVQVGPCGSCGSTVLLDHNSQCVACTVRVPVYTYWHTETFKLFGPKRRPGLKKAKR